MLFIRRASSEGSDLIKIREERPDDIVAIHDLNTRAFGQGEEARIVDAMRSNGAALTTIWQAAALGLVDRVRGYCTVQAPPPLDQITNSFWHACRGGQQEAAAYLLDLGANLNWIGHDGKTPLQAAEESGAGDLVSWLREIGARTAEQLKRQE
jgi:uncharacterized protein